MSRVKLLTPWDGPLPDWYPKFRTRMDRCKVVAHELVPIGRDDFNSLASGVLGVPCRKLTPHSQCDYRPAFGELFADRYADSEWWGWCDLDVVFGDLDRLLPLLLDRHDVVTADSRNIAGPFTIFRNDPKTRALFRLDDRWRDVFADPDYWNFDETGFDDGEELRRVNPSLSALVRLSGWRVRYDDRAWTESADQLPFTGAPSRGCHPWNGGIKNNRLFETPTGRELLLYHFTGCRSDRDAGRGKQWPIPDRFRHTLEQRRDRLKSQEPVAHPPSVRSDEAHSITSAAYWDARVESVREDKLLLHQSVYDCSLEEWNRIQRQSEEAVAGSIGAGASILDVGCGYGALYLDGYTWTRVDVSGAMVALAQSREPSIPAHKCDARSLPFANNRFNWCVCRGLEGSVRVREGNAEWVKFRDEMLRVAPRVLLLDYGGGSKVLKREDYRCS